jgi:hypothetical protein
MGPLGYLIAGVCDVDLPAAAQDRNMREASTVASLFDRILTFATWIARPRNVKLATQIDTNRKLAAEPM